MTPKQLVRFGSLMLSALSTGGFFGTRTSLGPSTRHFTPRTYVEVQQATIHNLRPVMGVLLPGAIISNLAVVGQSIRDRHTRGIALESVGLASQLAALVLTVAIELPINSQVVAWSPDNPPEGWEAVRDRWASVHTARTVCSVVGLAGLVGSALAPSRPL
jgi:uncharacterized membrane protein